MQRRCICPKRSIPDLITSKEISAGPVGLPVLEPEDANSYVDDEDVAKQGKPGGSEDSTADLGAETSSNTTGSIGGASGWGTKKCGQSNVSGEYEFLDFGGIKKFILS